MFLLYGERLTSLSPLLSNVLESESKHFLDKNTLQAKAVYYRFSASYGKILLQYLTACRLEFGLMSTVKGVFSLFARSFLQVFFALQARRANKIFDFIIQQIVTMPIYGKETLNICHPT